MDTLSINCKDHLTGLSWFETWGLNLNSSICKNFTSFIFILLRVFLHSGGLARIWRMRRRILRYLTSWQSGNRSAAGRGERVGWADRWAGVRRTPLSGRCPCSRISSPVRQGAGWRPGWCCPGSGCTPPAGCSSRWGRWRTCGGSGVVVQHCGAGFCTTSELLNRTRLEILQIRRKCFIQWMRMSSWLVSDWNSI